MQHTYIKVHTHTHTHIPALYDLESAVKAKRWLRPFGDGLLQALR